VRWKNTPSGYGSLSIALHWLMLLLIAAVYVSTELQGLFPKGSALRETMATWHSMLGLSVWLILDSRVVIGQFWRNSLFLQAFPGGLDRYGIFGKSHLI
jgi:cytochrome b561